MNIFTKDKLFKESHHNFTMITYKSWQYPIYAFPDDNTENDTDSGGLMAIRAHPLPHSAAAASKVHPLLLPLMHSLPGASL